MQKVPLTKDITRKARLLALAGDPTRMRILCFLLQRHTACVSDIAQALGMSVASISHHLQMMHDNEIVSRTKKGTMVCYTIQNNKFTNFIKTFICS